MKDHKENFVKIFTYKKVGDIAFDDKLFILGYEDLDTDDVLSDMEQDGIEFNEDDIEGSIAEYVDELIAKHLVDFDFEDLFSTYNLKLLASKEDKDRKVFLVVGDFEEAEELLSNEGAFIDKIERMTEREIGDILKTHFEKYNL